MVRMVTNWADLSGLVVGIRPSETSDLVDVEIEVESLGTVDAFPNLFRESAGDVVTIKMPAALATERGISEGVRVECQVRRGGPKDAFVHPDRITVRRTHE